LRRFPFEVCAASAAAAAAAAAAARAYFPAASLALEK
jgi:hypothetical protein